MGKAIKNGNILQIVNLGILDIDYSCIESENGYKVFKTLRAIKNAAKEIDSQRAEIVKQHITDEELAKMREYEDAKGEKRENLISPEEYASGTEKINAATKEISHLFDDETTIDVRPIPFKAYFELKKANKEKLNNAMDDILEDILWKDEESV